MKNLKKIKDYDKKTAQEKIELLDQMIKKITKKIKFREEFVKISPLWCKIYLLIPAITLVGTIVPCFIPIPGLIEFIYSYIVYLWICSIAIVEICLIIIPLRLVMSKTLKKLKNKNENMREIRKQIYLSKIKIDGRQVNLFESEQSKEEKNWEEIHQYMQVSESLAPFNPDTIFRPNEIIEEQNADLQYELDGPRLIKKINSTKHIGNK